MNRNQQPFTICVLAGRIEEISLISTEFHFYPYDGLTINVTTVNICHRPEPIAGVKGRLGSPASVPHKSKMQRIMGLCQHVTQSLSLSQLHRCVSGRHAVADVKGLGYPVGQMQTGSLIHSLHVHETRRDCTVSCRARGCYRAEAPKRASKSEMLSPR